MKKMKKSILSLIVVCAILANVFMFSTVSVSAASSPQLNLVKGSNCFNVVWNKVAGAVKYRLYFGAVSPNGNGWRRFTVLTNSDISTYPKNTKSWQFLINSNSLKNRKWYAYGDDKNISTPSLNTRECYQCQVEALREGDKHIAWTNVGYVFLGVPQTTQKKVNSITTNVIVNSPIISEGSVKYIYEIDYRPNSNYSYKTSHGQIYSKNYKTITFIFKYEGYRVIEYKVRTVVEKNGKKLAYGSWSSLSKINW